MPQHRFGKVVFGLVLLIAIAFAVAAEPETSPATRPTGPQRAFVGLYFNDLYELDLKKGTYTADFYVWLRWQGDFDPTNIEFLNGSLDLKEHPNNLEGAGWKYISYHCRGTFHVVFDYRRYPLDEHALAIEMEDGNLDFERLQYVVDTANVTHLPIAPLAGWTCGVPVFEIRKNTYQTNFGDPNRSADVTDSYSRLYCTIPISHRSFSIYVKTFLALFISVAIAFLSFVIRPTEMDPRFGVGLAAIFGAVSSEIVMSGNLPDMPYLTLADKIHLFSLFVIFLTLMQSCLGLRLVRKGNPALAARLDKISIVAFPAAYAVIVAIMTIGR